MPLADEAPAVSSAEKLAHNAHPRAHESAATLPSMRSHDLLSPRSQITLKF
jgi:hypothetical protein